jgi:hypothetical protein
MMQMASSASSSASTRPSRKVDVASQIQRQVEESLGGLLDVDDA